METPWATPDDSSDQSCTHSMMEMTAFDLATMRMVNPKA